MKKKLLTVKEVAAMMNVCENYVYILIRQGLAAHKRDGEAVRKKLVNLKARISRKTGNWVVDVASVEARLRGEKE